VKPFVALNFSTTARRILCKTGGRNEGTSVNLNIAAAQTERVNRKAEQNPEPPLRAETSAPQYLPRLFHAPRRQCRRVNFFAPQFFKCG